MAKKEYAFYPGCSSQYKASAANYLVSTNAMCRTLDIKLTEIPDWNCCGASISYTGASELTRHVLNARNFALAEKHLPGQDVVATCAACWLNARESKEKLDVDRDFLANANEALKEAGTVDDLEAINASFLGIKDWDGGVLDLKTFAMAEGLSWQDSAERTFTRSQAEQAEWVGARASAGRMVPRGFPPTGRFG